MAVLVGVNPSGDTFVISKTKGSVSGGPLQSNVSGIVALDGPDTATIDKASNLYDGLNFAGGNDTVTITTSTSSNLLLGEGDNTASLGKTTINGTITSGSGSDSINLVDSNVYAGMDTGAGDDTITFTGGNSHQIGGIVTGAGEDTVIIDGGVINTTFTTGDNDDTVTVIGGTVNSGLDTGSGDDTISFSAGATLQIGLITGSGADTISFSDTLVNGLIQTGIGADRLTVDGGTINSGIDMGADDDIVSVTDGSVIWAGVDGGTGMDIFYVPAGTIVTDSVHGTFTVLANTSYTVTSGSFELPSKDVITYSNFESMSTAPCFTAGTLIETPAGPVPVETLAAGDVVRTLDHGDVALHWIGSRFLCALELIARPKLQPVRIPAGALGKDSPVRDLVVSPQHRILVDSPISARMTGSAQILLPAVKLVGYNGISRMLPAEGIRYVHFMCQRHEIVFANGCPAESLYLGPQALKSLPGDAVEEIEALFPGLISRNGPLVSPARPFLEKRGKIDTLLLRHRKNGKELQRSYH